MKLSDFETDLAAAKKGVKVKISDTFSVTIACAGEANPEYSKTLRELMKPYRQQLRNDTIPESVVEDIVNKCYAECVLLDWEGLEGEDGEIVAYSKDAAYKILSDKKYVKFHKLIRNLAQEDETFSRQQVDETKSNS